MNATSLAIKGLRLLRGLEQSDLEEVLGVKRNSISEYESGKAQMKPAQIIALARFYNVSTDVILGLSPIPENQVNELKDPPFQYNRTIDLDPTRLSILEVELSTFKEKYALLMEMCNQKAEEISILKDAINDKQKIITMLSNERR